MWYQRKGNKYGASTKIYKNRVYHSKLEAKYAWELDQRVKNGEYKSWIPQYRVKMYANGKHICDYICDFKVILPDESVELHEVKGFETEVYRLKRKIMEATYLKEHPEIKYIVIKT